MTFKAPSTEFNQNVSKLWKERIEIHLRPSVKYGFAKLTFTKFMFP